MAKEKENEQVAEQPKPHTLPHKVYNLHKMDVKPILEEQDSGGNKCIGYDMKVQQEPERTNIKMEEHRITGLNGLDRAAHSRMLIHVEQGQKVPKLIERRVTNKKERRETGKEFIDNVITNW